MSRFIGLSPQPEGRGQNGRRLCRGQCGREVGPRRSSWCSDECQHEALIRAGFHSVIIAAVEARDGGVCALCGCDSERARRVIAYIRRKYGYHDEAVTVIQQAWGLSSWATHWWEADHIIPVAEGGGGCGLEGYRTLCRRCHAQETGLLRRRLNARKRHQRSPETGA